MLGPDGGGGVTSFAEGFAALFAEPAICDELGQVVDLALDGVSVVTGALGVRLRWTRLRIHARYSRKQSLAALGVAKLDGRKPGYFREGVLWMEHLQTDAFFATLKKSDTDCSPTTMYQDYAISPTLIHWETQSSTSEASPTGERYIRESGRSTQALIFCRAAKTSEFGTGAPYTLLGTARYVSHRGERPIAITWALDTPMTADMFAEASVVGA